MLLTPELEASFRQRYNPDGSSLRKAQLRMVDMLMWFDEIMRKHGGTMEMLDGIDQAVSAYKKEYTGRNLEVIRCDYSWEKLVDEHEEYFKWMLAQPRHG